MYITAPFNIGCMYNGAGPTTSEFFNGYISNVMIHNKSLSSIEVLQNFNALRGRFGI